MPNLYHLDRCPWCGSDNLCEDATLTIEIKGISYQTGWIHCNECGAEGPPVELSDDFPENRDYQKVRDAWNIRQGGKYNPSESPDSGQAEHKDDWSENCE